VFSHTSTQYNIAGNRVVSVPGTLNLFAGVGAGAANTIGGNNTFVGRDAGEDNTSGIFNTFVGASAGNNNRQGSSNTIVGQMAGQGITTGNNNTLIGQNANVGTGDLGFATAIGAEAVVSDRNSIVLGRANGDDAVLIDGSLVVHTLGSAGSTQLCLNAADRLAPCSSSLRYKSNVQSFFGGLDIVRRLRPITFDWKDVGMQDVGFGAEEVEKIEPRFIIHNKNGEIEGVKYAQLTTLLVNAVKEQQAQIEQYRKQFTAQQSELAAMKQLLCRTNRKAAVCQSANRLKR
jgi:trimeric autotransporter adhesin